MLLEIKLYDMIFNINARFFSLEIESESTTQIFLKLKFFFNIIVNDSCK